MALSDIWLRRNSSREVPKAYEKADKDGLSIRVSRVGTITFQHRFRFGGKAARVDIGQYPVVKLAEAREQVLKIKALVNKGIDPREEKKISREANMVHTVNYIFDSWVASRKEKDTVLQKNTVLVYNKQFRSVIGNRTASEITVPEWVMVFEDLFKRVPSSGKLLLSALRRTYKFAVRRGILDKNPLETLSSYEDFGYRQGTRARSLTDEEIHSFYIALNTVSARHIFKLYVQLLIIYACRPAEILKARVEHIDFKNGIWIVPPTNHKTGKKSKNPIVPATEVIFRELIELNHNGDLFHSRKGEPINHNVVWPFIKRLLPEGCSQYDLRKTARTNFSDLAAPHVAEIMLGHKLPGCGSCMIKAPTSKNKEMLIPSSVID